MVVCLGDWVVKELDTGYAVVMNEKRFNRLYRPALIKGPEPVDLQEEIRKAGIDLNNLRQAYDKRYTRTHDHEAHWMKAVNCQNHYGNNCPNCKPVTYEVRNMEVKAPPEWLVDKSTTSELQEHFAKVARELDKKIMENPSAIAAIMEAEELGKAADSLDAMRYGLVYDNDKKGDFTHVHRTDSTDSKAGPTDCCNRGTCEGCDK
jgi:hypothetical protein